MRVEWVAIDAQLVANNAGKLPTFCDITVSRHQRKQAVTSCYHDTAATARNGWVIMRLVHLHYPQSPQGCGEMTRTRREALQPRTRTRGASVAPMQPIVQRSYCSLARAREVHPTEKGANLIRTHCSLARAREVHPTIGGRHKMTTPYCSLARAREVHLGFMIYELHKQRLQPRTRTRGASSPPRIENLIVDHCSLARAREVHRH